MICAVAERSPGLTRGQKHHQDKQMSSYELKLELKFEGLVDFSQVKNGERRTLYRSVVNLCGAWLIRVGVMERERMQSSQNRRGLMW